MTNPIRRYTEHEPGDSCRDCGEPAKLRSCNQCGVQACIIDCGHMPQPRAISAGRVDATELDRDFCEECAERGDLAGPGDLCQKCGSRLDYAADVFCYDCGGPER